MSPRQNKEKNRIAKIISFSEVSQAEQASVQASKELCKQAAKARLQPHQARAEVEAIAKDKRAAVQGRASRRLPCLADHVSRGNFSRF